MQEIDLIFNLINATSLPCFPKTTLTISLIRQWFFFQRWSQYNFSKQPEENCIKSIEKHCNDILFTYSMRCSTLIMINFLSFNRRLYRLTKEQTSENYAYVHSATPPPSPLDKTIHRHLCLHTINMSHRPLLTLLSIIRVRVGDVSKYGLRMDVYLNLLCPLMDIQCLIFFTESELKNHQGGWDFLVSELFVNTRVVGPWGPYLT